MSLSATLTAAQTAPLDRVARVVVADRLPLLRHALAVLLNQEPDFSVVNTAGSGIEAVDAVLAHHPDLIMLGIDLPGMGGLEAARVIRDRAPNDLVAALRSTMRGQSPISPALVSHLLMELRQSVRPMTLPLQHPAPEDKLSRRELDILRLAAQGLSNKEIGVKLSITEGTVKNHVHNALHKLNLNNRIQAANYVVRRGLAD